MHVLLLQLLRMLGFMGGGYLARQALGGVGRQALSSLAARGLPEGAKGVLGFLGGLGAETLGGTLGGRAVGQALGEEPLPLGEELLLNTLFAGAGMGSRSGLQALRGKPFTSAISSQVAEFPGYIGVLAALNKLQPQQADPTMQLQMMTDPVDLSLASKAQDAAVMASDDPELSELLLQLQGVI